MDESVSWTKQVLSERLTDFTDSPKEPRNFNRAFIRRRSCND